MFDLRIIFVEQNSLFGRLIQLSVEGYCGDFPCHLTIAQRSDLDLSLPPWLRPKKSGNNVFSVSVCTGFPDAITTVNRIIIRQHVREAISNKPSFDTVGPLLAAA